MNSHHSKPRMIWIAIAFLVALGSAGIAQAQPNWCQICNDTGDCFACCRCGGVNAAKCLQICDGQLHGSFPRSTALGQCGTAGDPLAAIFADDGEVAPAASAETGAEPAIVEPSVDGVDGQG